MIPEGKSDGKIAVESYDHYYEGQRDIDALIAEHIMGYTRGLGPSYDYDGPCEPDIILIPPGGIRDDFCYPPRGKIAFCYHAPSYNSYLETALGILRKVEGLFLIPGGGTLYHRPTFSWYCGVLGKDDLETILTAGKTGYVGEGVTLSGVFAASPNLAICLGALKARGIEHPVPVAKIPEPATFTPVKKRTRRTLI